MYPGGTLTPPDKCYQGVVSGIADIGFSGLAYSTGRFPLTHLLDLPIGIKNGSVGTKLANEFYKKFHPKELDDTEVMYLNTNGPNILHTKKPIYKLEDLKGMKIRVTPSMVRIATILGAAPVGITMPEAYDGLSKGLVEGILSPFDPLEGFKLAEVVKYTTESYGIGAVGSGFLVMNKNKWNALSPDIQKTIREVNEEWSIKTGNLWAELDNSAKAFSLKLGNKIISLSKEENERWKKMVRPILDEYVNEMKAKGLPGEEALKFCLDYLEKNQ
jgi:TRAP-type C4-dicarboxylate transport system substrate-binding protein